MPNNELVSADTQELALPENKPIPHGERGGDGEHKWEARMGHADLTELRAKNLSPEQTRAEAFDTLKVATSEIAEKLAKEDLRKANYVQLAELAKSKAQREHHTENPDRVLIQQEAADFVLGGNWSLETERTSDARVLTAFRGVLKNELNDGTIKFEDSPDKMSPGEIDDVLAQYDNLTVIALEFRLSQQKSEDDNAPLTWEFRNIQQATSKLQEYAFERPEAAPKDAHIIDNTFLKLRGSVIQSLRLIGSTPPAEVKEIIREDVRVGVLGAHIKEIANRNPLIFAEVAPSALAEVEDLGDEKSPYSNRTVKNEEGLVTRISQRDFALNVYGTIYHNLAIAEETKPRLQELHKNKKDTFAEIEKRIGSNAEADGNLNQKISIIINQFGRGIRTEGAAYGFSDVDIPNEQEVIQVATALCSSRLMKQLSNSGTIFNSESPIADKNPDPDVQRSTFNIAVEALDMNLQRIIDGQADKNTLHAACGAFVTSLKALRRSQGDYTRIMPLEEPNEEALKEKLAAKMPTVLPEMLEINENGTLELIYGRPLLKASGVFQNGRRQIPNPLS